MDWMYKHIATICLFLVYYLITQTIIMPILGETPQSHVEPKPNCHRSSSSGRIIGSHKMERVSPCSPNVNRMKTPPSIKHQNKNEARVGSSINEKQNYNNSFSDNGYTPFDSEYGLFTVKVSLGTPQQDYNLIIDTGSHYTWVRCLSCTQGCKSDGPQYDPSKSLCKHTIPDPFRALYGDNSYTKGIWGCDTLTIDDLGSIMSFNFGCGEQNIDDDNFVNASGYIGLGKGDWSFISQSGASVFSYFVPENGGGADLHFGDKAREKSNTCSNQFTPMVQGSDPTYYYVHLVGISVDGNELSIDQFMSRGTIIDSGTIITRLPQQVYSAFRDAFRQFMSSYYKLIEENIDELMDTCYTLEGNEQIILPEIKLHFGQETTIDVTLPKSATIWRQNDTISCLAFAATEGYTNSIIGIVQQRGFNVLYDLEGERIGFGTNCDAS